MIAVDALRERSEIRGGSRPAAKPEADSLGLVWLHGSQQVALMGLEQTLRSAALVHKGQESPAWESPSAVICCANGGDVTSEVRSVRAVAPDAVVLVFSLLVDLHLARGALAAGASGLLHAGMGREEILRAVRLALEGETVLPRRLLYDWLDEQRSPDLEALLSARQREILGLVVEGASNAEIARHLFLSESTIKQNLGRAYKELGVANRTEAAAIFRAHKPRERE
jgi:DNA-binding NarL/FixJ family response regulator